ncbi:MAG: hypothetical protein CMJ31_09180 [Phycisphaerae bacterium]|nr:hypothetical protein [Phycisphaerae bacterium]|tara:strand:+ start:92 stop:1417 length:1326 start_codon:yes stop_codon:yes gene_type:complete
MNADALIQLWDRFRTSLWFLPAIMVSGALGLAAATPFIEGLMPDAWADRIVLVFSGRADGARAVLTTIATATIGVAGVLFSMTIVSLQLASSQFGPRLLRTFLRDRSNQLVLGTFLGTFLYCIVVLPSFDTSDDSQSGPNIAVTIAALLAMASLAMLVYFIDHVAQSIHVDAVINSVSEELGSVIDELYPENIGGDQDEPVAQGHEALLHDGELINVLSEKSGYIRFLNGDQVLKCAKQHNLFVRIELVPGAFVMHGECLATVWARTSVPAAVTDALKSAFVLGAHRTALQDILFAFEQISEVAMRAMSPGINDPTTAVHCVDRIGSGITRLVGRDIPSKWRLDSEGVVRIETESVALPAILESTVIAVSRTAGVHLPVWLRLLDVLRIAARRAMRPGDSEILRACASRLAEHGDAEMGCDGDRDRLRVAASWTLQAGQSA